MARRRRSYGKRSYGSSRRRSSSYSGRSSRSYSSRGRSRSRGSAGQTLRLVLQQPGMQSQRPPFGTFMPSTMMGMGPFGGGPQPGMMQNMMPGGMSATLPGDMSPAQGGLGVPGARMVVNQLPRSPRGLYVPPGYKLVRDDDSAVSDDELGT